MELTQRRLDYPELFRRLDALVPGDPAPGTGPCSLDTELYCERLSLAGLEEMHRYSIDTRLYEFFEFKPFVTIEDTRAYIAKLQGRMGDDIVGRTSMYWFARRKRDRQLIGTINLIDLNYARQSVEWGYGVDPQFWGEGYVLQIQELLKHYVFEVLRMNRLGGVTMLENERTITSVLAAGMKHEGTVRAYYFKDDTYHDGWIYGMLAEDYFHCQSSRWNARIAYTVADVIEVVSSVLVEDEIVETSSMHTATTWDSLNHMAVMAALAERTGIELSPRDIMRANSVRAILSILNRTP